MIRDDVCYLVAEAPAAHGIFDAPEETPRMVYCSVQSVRRDEFYRALENKLHPAIVFELQDAIEYQGEKIVLWQGINDTALRRFRVIRTYQSRFALELVCEEATVDA